MRCRNAAIASLLQSTRPVGRVAELGSLGRLRLVAMDIRSQLRGAWRVERVVAGGVENPREEGDEHFLWFGDDVIMTGNADAAWEMPYAVVGIGPPAEIDIRRNDRSEPWTERAVVRVADETLHLCSAGSADKDRPDRFESSAANGWMLYLATRCDEPVPT